MPNIAGHYYSSHVDRQLLGGSFSLKNSALIKGLGLTRTATVFTGTCFYRNARPVGT